MYLQDRLKQLLAELDERKAATPGLTDPQRQKLHYKLRLEMNYHSNRMEGNTLTLEETRSVMMDVLDVHHRSLKEVLEVRGHDKVMQSVLGAGQGKVRITERLLKELHRGIMHEPDAPEKANQIGRGKTQDNYLYTYRGERLDFTPASETPQAVNTLINWLDNQLYQPLAKAKAPLLHPVVIAAEFHVRFVSIHPFYDGNGRMARLLSALILIYAGHPLPLIRAEQRDTYTKTLADAQLYGQDPLPFYLFLTECVLATQQLVAKAAADESLDEPGDLDKKLALLDRQLQDREKLTLPKAEADYKGLILPAFLALAERCEAVVQKFHLLFGKTGYRLITFPQERTLESFAQVGELVYALVPANRGEIDKFQIGFDLRGFTRPNNKSEGPYDLFIGVGISFKQLTYDVGCYIWENHGRSIPNTITSFGYHEAVDRATMDRITAALGDYLYEAVRHLAGLDTPDTPLP
ncbi:MAG: Fic family protein [Bacteroidetes bacterium]|jgi:Fic family protein|nr:Fic family protein [Bacteroidota bacterium]